MISHARIPGVISVILVIICVTSSAHASKSSSEDEDSTICYYETYENGYTTVNVTYDCYKTEESPPPCQDDFWQIPPDVDDWRYHRRYWRRHYRRHHHLWKRQVEDGMCYRRVISQCTVLVRMCTRRVVRKQYCCAGAESDGLGGCVRSIECSERNGGCEQMCLHDDDKGHHCACYDGYAPTDKTQCADVDECSVNNGGCDQLCTNTDGGYYCSCRTGYTLDTPQTCIENNECLIGNGGCEHNCTDTEESYYCTCDIGFVLDGRHKCKDEDECADPIVENGGCSHMCVNVFGDYYCSCPGGYYLDDDAFNCKPATNAVAPVRDSLPLKESMTRPIVLGPIIGGCIIIILVLIIACCCLRRRRRTPPPPPVEAGPAMVFVVGKKKEVAMLDAVVPGDRKAKMAAASGSNDYSNTPRRKESFGKPPAYDEVMQKPLPRGRSYEKPADVYENVDSPPRYEKPKMPEPDPDPEPVTYTNLAYEAEYTNGGRNPDKDNIQNEEIEEVPNPYATVIKGLRKTGRENK